MSIALELSISAWAHSTFYCRWEEPQASRLFRQAAARRWPRYHHSIPASTWSWRQSLFPTPGRARGLTCLERGRPLMWWWATRAPTPTPSTTPATRRDTPGPAYSGPATTDTTMAGWGTARAVPPRDILITTAEEATTHTPPPPARGWRQTQGAAPGTSLSPGRTAPGQEGGRPTRGPTLATCTAARCRHRPVPRRQRWAAAGRRAVWPQYL